MIKTKSPNLIKFLQLTLLAIMPATYFLKQGIIYENVFANLTFWVFCLLYFLCIIRTLISSKLVRFNSLDILLFVFAFYLFFSVLWSPNFNAGIRKAVEFMFITLPIVYFVRFFIKEGREIEKIIKISIFIALLLIIPYMIDFFSSEKMIDRVTLRMVTPVAMGLFCSIHAYSSFYFFLKRKRNFFYMFSFILFLVALFLNGSRASIAGLTLAVFWFFLIRKKDIAKNVLVMFTTGFIIFALNRFIPFIKYLIYRFSIAFTPSGAASHERIILWKRALNSISENPLFGKGTGSESLGYAHNIFLEIGSENGLIGLFLFLCIIFLFFKMKSKIEKEETYKLVMGIFTICAFVSLFSFSYSFHRYLFFSFGLILSLYHFRRTKDALSESRINA